MESNRQRSIAFATRFVGMPGTFPQRSRLFRQLPGTAQSNLAAGRIFRNGMATRRTKESG
jgi:hypothetical protein